MFRLAVICVHYPPQVFMIGDSWLIHGDANGRWAVETKTVLNHKCNHLKFKSGFCFIPQVFLNLRALSASAWGKEDRARTSTAVPCDVHS